MAESIRIDYLRNPSSGLLVAVSDDVRGLFVTGYSRDEIQRKLPKAIAALREAGAERSASSRVGELPPGFERDGEPGTAIWGD